MRKKFSFKVSRLGSIALLITVFAIVSGIPATGTRITSAEEIPGVAKTAEEVNDSLDIIVQPLLEASARDFYDHQPPLPVAFRNVRLKFLVKAGGIKVYMLCGQFLAQDDPTREKWMDFATIKTSDYEQWIGSNAVAYCQDATEIPYTTLDLSAALKNRIVALLAAPPQHK